MASLEPSTCCLEGTKHTGTTTGTTVTFKDNWTGYLATAPANASKSNTAIVYFPDVFGIWSNSRLLADQFASRGYTCLLVDLFNGDQVPEGTDTSTFDFPAWTAGGSTGDNPHSPPHVKPIADAAIAWLREKGYTRIGAVGYCFGAKYVVLGYPNIDVGYVAHPSRVTLEELSAITGPLSICAAETDRVFPVELRYKSEEVLKQVGQPYQINLYSGVVHGFAVRGDLSKKHIKFAREQAFEQAIAWFNCWL